LEEGEEEKSGKYASEATGSQDLGLVKEEEKKVE
jgi:hypothetical protein